MGFEPQVLWQSRIMVPDSPNYLFLKGVKIKSHSIPAVTKANDHEVKKNIYIMKLEISN